jgi:NlpC/P60 family putative phage cell wall peptidase
MTREEIIAEAREWLGLPWQHQASLKGVACDCVGLARGVYEHLTGEKIPLTVNYPPTWHLFKSDPWLYEECKTYAIEIDLPETQPGDLLLFSFRPRFVAHHIGILTFDNTIIHSYMDVVKVVETRMDELWQSRLRHAFRYPGVVD